MKSMRAPVALALVVALSGCGAKGLSESSTREFVDAFEATMKTCDVDAAEKMMAPDFFLLQGRTPGYTMGDQVLKRAEAVAQLRRECQNTQNRGYTSQVKEVKVMGGNEIATVKLSVEGTFTTDGHKVASQSDQEYQIKWLDGAPKVLSVLVKPLHATYDGNAVY